MPDREGVHWAAQSSEKVSDKSPPHEVQAMNAAQASVRWSGGTGYGSMASLREKVEAELEQMDLALCELPGACRVSKLSVLELGGSHRERPRAKGAAAKSEVYRAGTPTTCRVRLAGEGP